jgi:multidrug efflux pump subunit AcrB
VPGLLGLCLCGLLLVPWLGQDFFPDTDSGQFILHVPDKTDMRIEETERLFDLVENYIRQTIPASEMEKLRNPGGLMPLPESRYDY